MVVPRHGPAGKLTRLFMRALHRELVDRLDVRLTAPLPPRRCRVHLLYPARPVLAHVTVRPAACRRPAVATDPPTPAADRPRRCPFAHAA